jgi:DNA polymerase I-like protein with 3'-5' exonuclease and polymerase domains
MKITRRRYLKHIQDELYEFKYNDNRQVDFNPLFTSRDDIQVEVPQEIKDLYIDKLNNTKNSYWKNKAIEDAKKQGITIYNNQSFIAESLRQCLNSVIQGSSADMSKKAMILLGQNEELKQLGFRMLFPVHDEIIAECPFENRQRCGELMSQLMISSGSDKIKVPMKCDVEKFFYWYGPDVSDENDELTMAQYNDYNTTGKYKDREDYAQ